MLQSQCMKLYIEVEHCPLCTGALPRSRPRTFVTVIEVCIKLIIFGTEANQNKDYSVGFYPIPRFDRGLFICL